jgi:hypothetical protein
MALKLLYLLSADSNYSTYLSPDVGPSNADLIGLATQVFDEQPWSEVCVYIIDPRIISREMVSCIPSSRS